MTASTRRVWSRADKQAIIAETEAPDVTVSMVARRHNMHASLLFRWRRDALEAARSTSVLTPPAFVPLALPAPAGVPSIERSGGAIEIELAGGHRLRADASVEIAVLRGVIKALVGR